MKTFEITELIEWVQIAKIYFQNENILNKKAIIWESSSLLIEGIQDAILRICKTLIFWV